MQAVFQLVAQMEIHPRMFRILIQGLVRQDLPVQLQDPGDVLRLRQEGGFSAAGEGDAFHLLRFGDVPLIAEEVEAHAQHQDQDHGAADPEARPGLLPEDPECLFHKHLRGEPADESPQKEEDQQRGEGGSRVLAPVEDGLHQAGEAKTAAQGHAPAEHGTQKIHRHHIPGGLHLPAAEQEQSGHDAEDAHRSVDQQQIPAAENHLSDHVFPLRGLSVDAVHVQPGDHPHGGGEVAGQVAHHTIPVHTVYEIAQHQVQEEVHRHRHEVQDPVYHGEDQDIPRELGAEGGEAVEEQEHQHRDAEEFPQDRGAEAPGEAHGQGEEGDDQVPRRQGQEACQQGGEELTLPPDGETGHAAGAAAGIQEAPYRHGGEDGEDRSHDLPAEPGQVQHPFPELHGRDAGIPQAPQQGQGHDQDPDEQISGPERPEALHAAAQQGAVKAGCL